MATHRNLLATPTLHDVAAKAGVSTATVSRTLNLPDQVTKRTRARVMSAVVELGYSPNFGALAMAAQRTKTIGAIIPTMENSIFARGLQAFQEELRRHGFTMLIASTSYDPQIEEDQTRALVARGADGLLLIGHDRNPSIYQFLETQGVPTLVTWAFDPQSSRPSVGFDNRSAMHEMAVKVVGLGHKHLAIISADTTRNDRAMGRIQGIQDAMAEAGLDVGALRIHETTYGIEEGRRAFSTIMAAAMPPTAVFCGNDVLAVGALQGAKELGLEVPKDISIIGFDDIELAGLVSPSLTTVHVPHREMGKAAARYLVNLLDPTQPHQPIELSTYIKMRESLGPPK